MKKLLIILAFLIPTLAHGSVSVVVNGTTYTIPQTNEKGWGANVTSWIQAMSSNTLQPIGGNFTLTNDANFGASFGLVSTYFKSRSANIAASGIFRLANADSISFRNALNTADLLLSVGSLDGVLSYGGIDLVNVSGAQTLTNKSIVATQLTGTINAARLPTPTASTLGGVQSLTQVASNWINSISTSGVPVASQPAFTDISGTMALAQLPTAVTWPSTGTAQAITPSNHGLLISGAGATATVSSVGATGTILKGTSAADPTFTATPVLGSVGTTGTLGFSGTTSGVITVQPQAIAGTYNFNLPATAGSPGNVLTSQGGGASAMTWTAPLVNPMTTGGDIIYGGAAGVATRLANGTLGYVLTSGGGTAAPTWNLPAISVAAKSANYTLVNSDDFVTGDSSGAAFTLTLPTAVGISGKIFRIKKIDTSFNQITVATTSAQTIDGASTVKLSTQYEEYAFVSNNANWIVLDRRIPTIATVYTPNISGGGTVVTSNFIWAREGSFLHIMGSAVLPAPAALTFGIDFPTGAPNSNTTIGSTFTVGTAITSNATANLSYSAIMASSSNTIRMGKKASTADNAMVAQNGSTLMGAGDTVSVDVRVPITGWD